MVQTSKQWEGRGDSTRRKRKGFNILVILLRLVQKLGTAKKQPQEQVQDHEICMCY